MHLTEDAGNVDLYDTSGPQARFYMHGSYPTGSRAATYRKFLLLDVIHFNSG